MSNVLNHMRELVILSRRIGRLMVDRVSPSPKNSQTPGALALVHNGRCGSTVLGSLLDQNPYLYWDGEGMVTHRKSEEWFRQLQGVHGESRFLDLQKLMSYSKDRTYILSVKKPLTYPSFDRCCQDLLALGFTRFVTLERKNLLRWLVSAEIGTQFQVWHLDKWQVPRLRKIIVDLCYSGGETLVERLRGIRRWHEMISQSLSGYSLFELEYEAHILENPLVAYQAVCEYLEVDATPVSLKHTRVNPFPLQDVIVNFAEVQSALRGTEFEWMLTE